MISLGVKGQRVDLSTDTFREKEREKKKKRIIGVFSVFFKTIFSKKL